MWKYEVIGPRREVFVSNVESRKRAEKMADQLARKSGKKFKVRPYRAPARTVVRVAKHPCTRHKHHPKDGPCFTASQVPANPYGLGSGKFEIGPPV